VKLLPPSITSLTLFLGKNVPLDVVQALPRQLLKFDGDGSVFCVNDVPHFPKLSSVNIILNFANSKNYLYRFGSPKICSVLELEDIYREAMVKIGR
jgi:hypothetical protein